MYYDILGISTYGTFDPNDIADLTSLQLNGEQVGNLITSKNEFPYDWSHGHIIYIFFLCVIFMGTIILEGEFPLKVEMMDNCLTGWSNTNIQYFCLKQGVDTSIMAQVTPSQLNSCFINAGLLATLIGTLGRVLADSMITFSALLDIHLFVDFVNATFLPLLLLAVGCLLLVHSFYVHLV
jgi:hypothetical protein